MLGLGACADSGVFDEYLWLLLKQQAVESLIHLLPFWLHFAMLSVIMEIENDLFWHHLITYHQIYSIYCIYSLCNQCSTWQPCRTSTSFSQCKNKIELFQSLRDIFLTVSNKLAVPVGPVEEEPPIVPKTLAKWFKWQKSHITAQCILIIRMFYPQGPD